MVLRLCEGPRTALSPEKGTKKRTHCERMRAMVLRLCEGPRTALSPEKGTKKRTHCERMRAMVLRLCKGSRTRKAQKRRETTSRGVLSHCGEGPRMPHTRSVKTQKRTHCERMRAVVLRLCEGPRTWKARKRTH